MSVFRGPSITRAAPERKRHPHPAGRHPHGDRRLKADDPRFLVGVSLLGYGCSLAVGLGVPIPLLNEDMAHFCAVRNEDIITPVVDYGHDYPTGSGRVLGEATYAQLMSGKISLDGQEVPTVPLSSMVRAREVANILKEWIASGRFLLGEPVELLPSGETPAADPEEVGRES
jgi:L-aspartate semialdehyde sulfurtransferase